MLVSGPTRHWLAMTRPLVPWEQIAPRIAEHTEYLATLASRGQALASGPFLVDGSPRGEGMTILRAADEAEARALADADPLVRDGLRRVDLCLWQVNQIASSISL